MDWLDPLIRGLIGLTGAVLLFLVARWRFTRRGIDAITDNGLD